MDGAGSFFVSYWNTEATRYTHAPVNRNTYRRACHMRCAIYSFNGAAVVRPRKAVAGRPRVRQVDRLQWGRGCETAERGNATLVMGRLGHRLQWGRGCETAERLDTLSC